MHKGARRRGLIREVTLIFKKRRCMGCIKKMFIKKFVKRVAHGLWQTVLSVQRTHCLALQKFCRYLTSSNNCSFSDISFLFCIKLGHCSSSRIPRWPVLICCVSGFTWFATTRPCAATSHVRSRPPPPCCTTQRWAHLKPPDWEWCGWTSTRLVAAGGCCCCTRIFRGSCGEEEQKWCILDRYLLDIVQSEKKSWVQQT